MFGTRASWFTDRAWLRSGTDSQLDEWGSVVDPNTAVTPPPPSPPDSGIYLPDVYTAAAYDVGTVYSP